MSQNNEFDELLTKKIEDIAERIIEEKSLKINKEEIEDIKNSLINEVHLIVSNVVKTHLSEIGKSLNEMFTKK